MGGPGPSGGASGFSGRSGYSGYSGGAGGGGASGYSGYSGLGTSGYSGYSAAGSSIAPLVITDANTVEQYDSTNPQAFNIYNTRTDASNYERVSLNWAANEFFLQTQSAGTGAGNRNFKLTTGGNFLVNSAGFLQFAPGTVNTWYMDPSSRSFLANNDNTNDIGASGATRPRTGYFGTSVISPLLQSTSDVQVSKTITPALTTGNQTINKTGGSIRIAAAGSSVVLTNSLITVNSVLGCWLSSNDTTAKSVAYVLGAGSVTFYLNAAATAELEIRWLVVN